MLCPYCNGSRRTLDTLSNQYRLCLECIGGIASCCEGNSGSNNDATDQEFRESSSQSEHKGDDKGGPPAETSGSGEPIQPEESESAGVGEGRQGGEVDTASPRKNGSKRNRRQSEKNRGGQRRNFRRETIELKVPSEEDGEYEVDAEGYFRSECKKVNHPLSLARVKFLERE